MSKQKIRGYALPKHRNNPVAVLVANKLNKSRHKRIERVRYTRDTVVSDLELLASNTMATAIAGVFWAAFIVPSGWPQLLAVVLGLGLPYAITKAAHALTLEVPDAHQLSFSWAQWTIKELAKHDKGNADRLYKELAGYVPVAQTAAQLHAVGDVSAFGVDTPRDKVAQAVHNVSQTASDAADVQRRLSRLTGQPRREAEAAIRSEKRAAQTADLMEKFERQLNHAESITSIASDDIRMDITAAHEVLPVVFPRG